MRNQAQLFGDIKSTFTAFVLFFFLGAHYAYMGKWGIQFLFWFTLGGLGIWTIVDIFMMSGMVQDHNNLINKELEAIEDLKHKRQLEVIAAVQR